MREYLPQQFAALTSTWAAGISVASNSTVSTDPNGTVYANLIELPVNAALSNRDLYAYVWAKAASDALAYFELRVSLLYDGAVQVNLPLLWSYKTSGLGTAFRTNAFTWSDTATPIILPRSITLKVESNFQQSTNPPADEPTAPIYLHPFPVNYPISRVRVDVVRWTNIDVARLRVAIVSKAV